MLSLIAYTAVAAWFYLASAVDMRRADRRKRSPQDRTDRVLLHLVAVVASLLWPVALPALARVVIRRLRPLAARLHARVSRFPDRRTRLAS